MKQGQEIIEAEAAGPPRDAEGLGTALARKLLEQGAARLIEKTL